MRIILNTFLVTGMMYSVAPGIASSNPPNVTSDGVIFYINHDNIPAGHKVTDADVTEWFLAEQSRAGISNDNLSPDGGAIDIVADPSGDPARGNVMRVFQSEGGYGYTDGLNGPSGGQWRSWPGNHEELYFAYDFYMDPNRLWSKEQKLPGLMGGDWAAASGGSKGGAPDGTNGFSARLQLSSAQAYPGKGDGSLAQYTYYTDTVQKPLWYDDGPGGQINLEHGKWYTIETYIKLNTPGKTDGKMHAWVDGELVLNRNNVEWRTVDSLKLDGVFFVFGYGGGDSSFATLEDQYNYFDNWVLSTQPITMPQPVVKLSAETIDFGSQDVGGISNPLPLTLTNNGVTPLAITGISITGDYVETNNCNNYVPAGGECTIDVKYVPTTAGVGRGVLIINDDTVNSTYSVGLSGIGSGGVRNSDAIIPDDVILYIHHDNVPAGHKVTDADITEWFLADQRRAGISNDNLSPDGGAIDIVPDPTGDPARGNVMRVFQSEGGYGYTDGLNGPSGGQWRSWLGKHEELYFAFDFYMAPDRLWSKAQKLPGLMGGDWGAASGGTKGGAPDGTNGFSARLQLFSTRAYPGKGDGALAQYAYYTDTVQNTMWYDDGPGGQSRLEHGQWYTIETYIKLNTPGKTDGKMHAWVDGEKVLNRNNVKWRVVDSLKLDGVYFLFGYGGADSSFSAPEDQYNYYDNWILSTQPISH